MEKTLITAPKADNSSKLERKWGGPLIAAGWLGFPSVFLRRQRAFALDPLDLNILLQIADHWWDSENLPYPAKKTIAERVGVHARTVQRRIAQMEADGLIKRVERRDPRGGSKTNIYQFDGLIAEAQPYAKEILEERLRRKAEKSERAKRKRPLRVVRG